jgi:hypothetical protein
LRSGRDPLGGGHEEFLNAVLRRWRAATTNQQTNVEELALRDTKSAEPIPVAPLQPLTKAEPPRPSVLKRVVADRLDLTRAFEPPAQTQRSSET